MSLFISCALAEEAAANEAGVVAEVMNRFADLGATGWITLVTFAVLGVVIAGMSATRKRWSASAMAYAALSVALGFVLSFVKVFEMPQGGSVTLASMLPIMLFAAAYGMGPGMLTGAVYGMLQYLQGGWFVHPIQFVLDYPLAFAMIGLAGLYRHLPKGWQKWSLFACMILGAVGRAASATLAGIFFWETAPWASLVYNGTYLIPDTAICILLAIPVAPRIMKVMKK